jgi:hypothetical protein
MDNAEMKNRDFVASETPVFHNRHYHHPEKWCESLARAVVQLFPSCQILSENSQQVALQSLSLLTEGAHLEIKHTLLPFIGTDSDRSF